MLTRTPWQFRCADHGADLRAQAPLIGLDPRGRIREVRFNSRSMEPLRGTPTAHAEAAYAAYLAWARLLRRPELAARNLPPGCASRRATA